MSEPKIEKHVETVSKKGAKWLRSKHAGWVLGLIAFTESVFLPIIIDPFLVALILANRAKWLYYTTISIVASVVGGTLAYFLGSIFFETVGQKILSVYGFSGQFAAMASSIDSNGFVFVLIGALTPIPYKVVALAAGFTQVDIVTFLAASIFGRTLRLGLVGYIAYAVGPHALPLFRKHLLNFAYLAAVLLVAYLIIKSFY